jgi:hypothetical protein
MNMDQIENPGNPGGFSRNVFVAFLLWFGSYAYLYVFYEGGPKPLYSYYALLAFTLGSWVYTASHSNREVSGGGSPATSPLLAWIGLFLAYGALEFLNSPQDFASREAFIILGEACLLTTSFFLFMRDKKTLRKAMAAFAFLALLGVALNIYDFLIPTFSNVPGRAAGLYVNPNIAGSFIAMAMVAGLSVIPSRMRIPFVLSCGLGVVVTFSRESWIIWGLAVFLLGWRGDLGSKRRRLLLASLAALIGLGFVVALFMGTLEPLVAHSPVMHYLDANTLARLGIGASSISGDAARVREEAISVSLRAFSRAPWIGHGIGYNSQWRYIATLGGTANMYLLFMVDGGILGLALFLALIFLLWSSSQGLGKVVAIQFLVESLFTNNLLEQPAFLAMLAFIFSYGLAVRRVPGERSAESFE